MKHLVSHAQDGTIQLAIVTDDGELEQIGQFIWPPGYGLTEAAILGSNLSQFLANGQQATTPALPPSALVIHEHDGPGDMRKPRPVTAAERERKKLKARESYYRKKGHSDEEAAYLAAHHASPGKPAPKPGHVLTEPAPDVDAPVRRRGARPNDPSQRYITWPEVAAVIDIHPEGIGCAAIAKDIVGYPARWATKAVSNRVDQARKHPDFPYRISTEVSRGGMKRNRYHGPAASSTHHGPVITPTELQPGDENWQPFT